MTRRDQLTALVQEQVGAGKRFSLRAFVEVAVDPETGYQPGKTLIGKITQGLTFEVSPQLISALAAGLGLPREEVVRAAAVQFLGYEVTDPTGGGVEGATVRVAREPNAQPGVGPMLQQFLDEELGDASGR
ncbi:hypothetical protein GCM10009639_52140 [Kitasatospora putterlickiae]|uniref:Uncharacterized protein n=1 Tax=Kitasatospora putterlickiae TaxID=221725 RepID=A0ABN1YD76_9ACTN